MPCLHLGTMNPQLDLSPRPAATSALCTGMGRRVRDAMILGWCFWQHFGSWVCPPSGNSITQLPPLVGTSPPGQVSPASAAPRKAPLRPQLWLPIPVSAATPSPNAAPRPNPPWSDSQVLLLGSARGPAAKFRRELWSHGTQSPGSAGETEPGLGPGVPSQVCLVSLAEQPG